jgi:phosphoenolpyruvate phosphomutase
MSARIAFEAGIPGLWASSLTLSCVQGVRDNSEMTMTEALQVLEAMTTAVSCPVLFDGDTGYGTFGHFQQLVKRLESRSVAGVAIEDKVFPKTNSFLRSEQQELAPIEEFCGKIRAGKDVQKDEGFVIVARTEALIAGLGMDAAIERAERYVEAGADAILIHSKARTFAEIAEFMRRFSRRVPVVCVPTTYYSTPPEAFAEAGVSLAIWGNHMLRASVQAMKDVASRIAASGSAREVESQIASVGDLFRLQDAEGLFDLERIYAQGETRRAIVLAASRGSGLDSLTVDRPKCMIPVGGEAVVSRLVRHLRACGVRDIHVVRGYRGDAITLPGVAFADNDRFDETGELYSLSKAKGAIGDDVVIVYGDLLLKRYVLHELLAAPSELAIVVDISRDFLARDREADRVRLAGNRAARYDESPRKLISIATDLADDTADGEWIGLMRARGPGAARLAACLDEVLSRSGGEKLTMVAVITRLLETGSTIDVITIQKDWSDVDEVSDVVAAVVE